MKICYLYLHRMAGRGSGRYMQSLLTYFKAKRHSICVVEGMRSQLKVLRGIAVKYVHFPFQIPVYQGRADVKKNVKISGIPDSQLFSLIRRFAEWEVKMNERTGIDITHANHVSILPFSASLAKKINHVPYVVTAHGTGMLSSLESKRNFEIAKMGLEESEKVIANSKFTKSNLIKDFGIQKNKIKVIYPGVDTDVFKPASPRVKKAIKRKYRCTGKRVVFSSGFFTEEKGFQYLLKAASIYEKKDPNIVTLITGQGDYQHEMEKLIEKYDLKNTKILGWVTRKDLIKIYGAADLFVTPSTWHEPFGLVSVEALASKTPVIATKMGGIPEIVTRDVGETVESKSGSAIANAVLDRINDDCWLRKKGKHGRERVIEHFSVKAGGRETEKVYRKAIR
ncbi:MAG: glycosyltransferase family 4 protein [Candidatus Aenigmatarchaeota archaeon]|nr:MAG: glycosyltransferase family 4 protein [Candidatus Aenigmarchaeota archaeon]